MPNFISYIIYLVEKSLRPDFKYAISVRVYLQIQLNNIDHQICHTQYNLKNIIFIGAIFLNNENIAVSCRTRRGKGCTALLCTAKRFCS